MREHTLAATAFFASPCFPTFLDQKPDNRKRPERVNPPRSKHQGNRIWNLLDKLMLQLPGSGRIASTPWCWSPGGGDGWFHGLLRGVGRSSDGQCRTARSA